MKKPLALIISAVFILFHSSCEKYCRSQDEKLNLEKTDYAGNLRTNGYYYHRHESGYDMIFLYRDGIAYDHRYSVDSLEGFDAELNEDKDYFKLKDGWGKFAVGGDLIAIECWTLGLCAKSSQLQLGNVLNDTTFYVVESLNSRGSSRRYSRNDTFHFRPHKRKPDSSAQKWL